ncbi:TIGR03086 family protein [Egibacter rhizosphaerae]|uniref:TIGR03086 family protein n=1 Tax=Egibacter rhizosphaerae TaxID=1670831 RepID=A0A411YAI0_9ACTN|nr:TIGR03086 family metal-binding protein [Egibacter rhizosphaerae]QBI18188.1 TIGR03086 family protein [Egibacter rhizosphaerae]
MADLVRFHHRALGALDESIEHVDSEDWPRPTPCESWSVRGLVNHLTAEALWAPHLLRGETLEEVGQRYEGDVLGPRPHEAWKEAGEAERRAVGAEGALDGTVHTSMGQLDASTYLAQRLTDLVVHRWDLARALGHDGTVPEDIATYLYERWAPHAEGLAASGLFAPPVEVGPDASASDRLIALLGRRP